MDVVLYKNLILLYLPKCSQGLTSFFCEDEEPAAKWVLLFTCIS